MNVHVVQLYQPIECSVWNRRNIICLENPGKQTNEEVSMPVKRADGLITYKTRRPLSPLNVFG